jgi:hypothetical protein
LAANYHAGARLAVAHIDLLHSEIVKVMVLPDVKERMAVPKWGKVIRDANIKAEP